ncbi:hypothetical protein Tco_0170755 [Tanacetum coccineum]
MAMGGVSGGSVCGYQRRVVTTGDLVAVAGRGGRVVVAGRDGDGCAADKEHLEVVKELLKYSDKETLTRRSRL